SKLNALWPNNPQARASLLADYQEEKIQQRAQAIARNTPANQPLLLDKFIAANPGQFTQEQIKHVHDAQIAATEAPYHQATAAHEAIAAKKIDELNQLADNHDPNLAAHASAARQGGWIDDQQYR